MNTRKRKRKWYDDVAQDTKGLNATLFHTKDGFSSTVTKRHFFKPPAQSRIVRQQDVKRSIWDEKKQQLPSTGVAIRQWNIHGQRTRVVAHRRKPAMPICGISENHPTVAELLPPNHYRVQHGQEVDGSVSTGMDLS